MQLKTIAFRTLFLSVALSSTVVAAAPLQEECDGETKTCCLANEEFNPPAMWVKVTSCPKGMSDTTTCPLEYGCKVKSASSAQ